MHDVPRPMRQRRVVVEPERALVAQERIASRAQKVAQPIRRRKIPQGKDREPLKARRKRARKRLRMILCILFILIGIGILIALWQPVFRIEQVQAAGPDATGVETTATTNLYGTIGYVIPRNSVFFFPQEQIRLAILKKYPDISAVSISRTSFDSIVLESISRESAFLWCGQEYGNGSSPDVSPTNSALAITPLATSTVSEPQKTTVSILTSSSSPQAVSVATNPSAPLTCYNTDNQGFIFSAAGNAASSTGVLEVYDPLQNPSASPIGQKVENATSIPNALEFVKAIKTLGVPIVSLVIRSDEADLYAQSGTRITYVLGDEQAAAELASSAFPSLNLNDGSLEYVDLRFSGKVYFKKIASGSNTGNVSEGTSTSQ